jgi:DNA mismatch repair protein MutL
MGAPTENRERRIRILPDRLANLIAAGEVVERPSAVVKELVENGMDAGASSIRVELVSGGRRMIQVADNGSGMNADDAVLALERHATSKIADTRDLDSIASYGFRGEALPSIASVSRLRIQTSSDDSGIGTEVVIEGGQLRNVKETGRTRGTTMVVRDLFYNTPARRKFLRTEQTELRHCSRELTGLALSAPETGFRLLHGGRELLSCDPVRTWQDRSVALFGAEMQQRGVEFDGTVSLGRIYGLLGRPGDVGGGYREQYLLVNGRLVQARALRKAILDGYENTLESGRQPFFVVFLELDPALVDVNVHPQKREVRFHDERAVYGFVKTAVANAFSGNTASPHTNTSSRDHDAVSDQEPPSELPGVGHFITTRRRPVGTDISRVSDDRGGYSGGTISEPPQRDTAPMGGSVKQTPQSFLPRPNFVKQGDQHEQPQLGLDSQVRPVARPGAAEILKSGAEGRLWQFQQKYIFVNTDTSLWIIDQHVAHERVLFEEATAAFEGQPSTSQKLLLPVTVELTPEQDAIFTEVEPMLVQMGFELEHLSGRGLMVSAHPSAAENWADGALLRELIDDMNEPGFKQSSIRERVATSYSCKAAIKAGDPLTGPTMKWLIEALFATSMPYVCPHGRPIVVEIGVDEFDHRFGRT